MIRDHDLHHDHADEAVRVRALQRHEDRIRTTERERERRRVLALLVDTEPVEDDEFPGCFW